MTEFQSWGNNTHTYPRQDIATQKVATDSLCVVQGGGIYVF